MASLQLRNGSWRVIFRYRQSQQFVTIGKVDKTEAEGVIRLSDLLRVIRRKCLLRQALCHTTILSILFRIIHPSGLL